MSQSKEEDSRNDASPVWFFIFGKNTILISFMRQHYTTMLISGF